MSDLKGFVPPDIGDDEHIIHRLGWAAVRLWPYLPEGLVDHVWRPPSLERALAVDAKDFDPEGRVLIKAGDLEPIEFD